MKRRMGKGHSSQKKPGIWAEPAANVLWQENGLKSVIWHGNQKEQE